MIDSHTVFHSHIHYFPTFSRSSVKNMPWKQAASARAGLDMQARARRRAEAVSSGPAAACGFALSALSLTFRELLLSASSQATEPVLRAMPSWPHLRPKDLREKGINQGWISVISYLNLHISSAFMLRLRSLSRVLVEEASLPRPTFQPRSGCPSSRGRCSSCTFSFSASLYSSVCKHTQIIFYH